MNPRICAITSLVFAFISAAAFGQTYPPSGPDQPIRPQTPRIERRAGPPAAAERSAPPQSQPQQPPPPPPPPFRLTPQQEAQVDRVLNLWEERNRKIKTFDCRFKRWIYDDVFQGQQDPDKPLQPKYIESGVIKFAAPDRGMFRVETAEKDGREVPIEPNQTEHWICDGRAVYEFDPVKKQVTEHKLPPELQGKAIANSPLPFLFGAEAKNLKARYYIRIITPPEVGEQIWLEAYPRYQQDAANFHHAQFIIAEREMRPFALRLVEPNGKDYRVYQFYDIVVNDPLKFFKGDPFRPFTPVGWQLVPDATRQPAQARRPPPDGRR